jgi:hypothetical protein
MESFIPWSPVPGKLTLPSKAALSLSIYTNDIKTDLIGHLAHLIGCQNRDGVDANNTFSFSPSLCRLWSATMTHIVWLTGSYLDQELKRKEKRGRFLKTGPSWYVLNQSKPRPGYLLQGAES